MHKILRSTALALVAVALALVPALAQEQEEAKKYDKYVGTYEFEAPDYGVMEIGVALTEDQGGLTLSAMGNAMALAHISGHSFEIESPDFGTLAIGFIEEDDGSISAMTIDSYDFSFVATKKKQ